MNKKYYNKGSEWHKWDMHVHTPASILNNDFGPNWDNYVKQLFQSAIRNEIVAIGITDYFSIDGYKIVRNDYLNNESKLQELFADDEIEKIHNIFVFPNVEFRINKLVIGKEHDLKWNRKVNFHVIFSDQISPEDIEDNFLHQLKFENTGLGEGTPQQISLTQRNIEELGKRLIKEHSEFGQYSPQFVGMLNASVDDNEILKILASQKDKFKGKYLLALPADEDLSIVSWSTQGHLSRKVLLQKSHIILSANKGTIDFCLGRKHSTIKEFISEFGNPKPCLWGSDAHNFEKLFKPDNDKYTWIKAIPTFEGLKQVVFEPYDRVKIQLNKPEEKTPYLVIDKVRFIDKTQKKIFQEDWIELNQNLNTIIGGKSSGKSLLLYHIAKTIDAEQVLKKNELISGANYDDFVKDFPFDFEVIWKNGDRKKLSDTSEGNSQITYIPQLYINHLAEENGEQQLTNLINSILLQNKNYEDFITDKKENITNYKTNIHHAIEERLNLMSEYKELIKKRNEIGNEKKIQIEIERLNKIIDKLKKESGFNEEQLNEYRNLTTRIEKLDKLILEYRETINSINSYKEFVFNSYADFQTNSENIIKNYNDNTIERIIINKIHRDVFKTLEKESKIFSEELDKLIEKINFKINTTEKVLKDFKEKIKPYKQKIKNQELLKKLDNDLTKQKNKLRNLEKVNNEIKKVVEKGKQAKEKIFYNYNKLFNCYNDIENELKKPEYFQIDDDIKLESTLTFDTKRFENFTELFDNRSRLNNYFIRIFDDNNRFIYDKATHVATIKEIFEKLKTGEIEEIKLKSYINIKDLFYKLLEDYFKIEYRIIYKNDNFLRMSPGKRGLVLLQLILHISNASHPILIDQPEDNLDNRTIYDDLKQFIKDKKKKRQIIIVTHNANIVVSTDAENIVIANQAGQQVGKDKKEYIFEYVNGALENTFIDESQNGILYKYGIREHVCDILEGGKDAFIKREQKYGFV